MRNWLLLALLLAGCADPRLADMNGRVNTLRMAIEQYGTDHDGRYPEDARTLGKLVAEPGYGALAGKNPYGGPNVVVYDARAMGRGGALGDPPVAPGTLLYAYDRRTKLYVIMPVIERRGEVVGKQKG